MRRNWRRFSVLTAFLLAAQAVALPSGLWDGPLAVRGTVPTASSSVAYTSDGSTKTFVVPFIFQLSSDLVVSKTVSSVTTVLTLNSQYSVSGAGVTSGGTVTLVSAVTTGGTVTIARVVPYTQLVSLRTQGAFFPAVHEKALDKLTMEAQQNAKAVTDLGTQLRSEMAADAGATVLDTRTVQATGTTSARTLADRFAESFNAQDFSATAGGTVDDTSFVQAEITAACSSHNGNASYAYGGIVHIPRGTYKITSTLTITGCTSVRLVGDGKSSTVLKWAGATGQDFIRIENSMYSGVSNLAMETSSTAGVVTKAMIAVLRTATPGGFGNWQNDFENIWMLNGSNAAGGGNAQYGFRFYSSLDGNNDFQRVVRCRVDVGTTANASIEASQIQGAYFEDNHFTHGPYGLTNALAPDFAVTGGGSFQWYGGGMSTHTTADFYLSPSSLLGEVIEGVNSEQSDRFLITSGVANTAAPILVRRNRFSCDSMNADGYWIKQQEVGPLTVEGNVYGQAASLVPRIYLVNGTVNAVSVDFSNNTCEYVGSHTTHPIKVTLGASTRNVVHISNNTFQDGSDNPVVGAFDTDGARGTVTIADAATSAAVTFGTAEPDANFDVLYFVAGKAGAPAAGSNRVTEISSKTSAGFTLNVEVAPGAGTSRSFSWQLHRYPLSN